MTPTQRSHLAVLVPTIDAVDSFVAKHGLELQIIDDGDHPSWWIIKPII
jgi:hypothetical protein